LAFAWKIFHPPIAGVVEQPLARPTRAAQVVNLWKILRGHRDTVLHYHVQRSGWMGGCGKVNPTHQATTGLGRDTGCPSKLLKFCMQNLTRVIFIFCVWKGRQLFGQYTLCGGTCPDDVCLCQATDVRSCNKGQQKHKHVCYNMAHLLSLRRSKHVPESIFNKTRQLPTHKRDVIDHIIGHRHSTGRTPSGTNATVFTREQRFVQAMGSEPATGG